MKITFIGYKDSSVDIFPTLGKALKKKISGLELDVRFAPFAEDLPELAREASEESDFIFVFALLSNKANVEMIEEKLIDVEIETKTRILKAVKEDDMSSEEEDYIMEKENIVEKYLELILGILFNEKSFSPKDRDFGL